MIVCFSKRGVRGRKERGFNMPILQAIYESMIVLKVQESQGKEGKKKKKERRPKKKGKGKKGPHLVIDDLFAGKGKGRGRRKGLEKRREGEKGGR